MRERGEILDMNTLGDEDRNATAQPRLELGKKESRLVETEGSYRFRKKKSFTPPPQKKYLRT